MRRLELPNKPVNKFEIWLNKRCNFNCEYCGVHDNKFLDPKPDYDKLKEFFPYVDKNAFITILGGEPTLSNHIRELILFLKNNNFNNINIYTNFKDTKNIDKINDLDIKYLVTYHPDQTEIKTFLKNIKPHKNKISQIMVMWISKNSTKILREYQIIKNLFNRVSLEPTYQIDSKGNMNKSEFDKFKSLGLVKESKLLSLHNDLLDKSYIEMINKELNKRPKLCNVKNEIIIFDVVTNERYNCCTESGMKRKYDSEIQYEDGYCITECSLNLEHIVDYK